MDGVVCFTTSSFYVLSDEIGLCVIGWCFILILMWKIGCFLVRS